MKLELSGVEMKFVGGGKGLVITKGDVSIELNKEECWQVSSLLAYVDDVANEVVMLYMRLGKDKIDFEKAVADEI